MSPAPFSHPEWQKLPWDLVSPPSARTVGARASHVASLVTGVLSRGIVRLGLPLFLNCVFQISAPFVYPLSSSKRRPPLRVLLAQALPAPHAGLSAVCSVPGPHSALADFSGLLPLSSGPVMMTPILVITPASLLQPLQRSLCPDFSAEMAFRIFTAWTLCVGSQGWAPR